MKAPKILPWIARKAGISDELALKLWRRAASEAEYLTGKAQGSEYYGLAVERFLSIVEDAKQFNEKLVVRVLLTRIDPRTKDTGEMLTYLEEKGLQVLKSKVCERVAVRRAVGEGAIVQEVGKDGNAVAEIEAFFEEVTK